MNYMKLKSYWKLDSMVKVWDLARELTYVSLQTYEQFQPWMFEIGKTQVDMWVLSTQRERHEHTMVRSTEGTEDRQRTATRH